MQHSRCISVTVVGFSSFFFFNKSVIQSCFEDSYTSCHRFDLSVSVSLLLFFVLFLNKTTTKNKKTKTKKQKRFYAYIPKALQKKKKNFFFYLKLYLSSTAKVMSSKVMLKSFCFRYWSDRIFSLCYFPVLFLITAQHSGFSKAVIE